MNQEIELAIENLVASLRQYSPDNMTSFRLFVNCEEIHVETSTRTPEQLKANGISMRNLRGHFIKP